MSTRNSSLVIALAVIVGTAGGTAAPLAIGATTPDATTGTSTTPASTTPANPTPPKPVTGSPESLTRTSATLAGTIAPGGADTSYFFEYGTTTGYGLKTAAATVPAGAGADAVAVKQAISGLTVGTTYHYRLVATNAAGTANGSDKTLKTIANPKAPSVSTQSATGVAAQAANLVARINPNGQSTTYYFQYGTSTSYKSKTGVVDAGAGVSTITATVPVASLSANTKYHFRVVATNPTGTVRGSDRTFTTPRGVTGVGITATPTAVTWGAGTQINGTVAGLGVGGVKVALLRQDFPYATPPAQVATQTTSSAGAYSFTVSPLYTSSKLWVVAQTTPAVTSPLATVHSALLTKLRISKRAKRTMTLRGLVYPAVPQGRAAVQRRTSTGRWIRVRTVKPKQPTAANRSSYSVTVPRLSRKTSYRVVVSPKDGGAHVKTTTKSVAVARKR
jgi:hypothetical protein